MIDLMRQAADPPVPDTAGYDLLLSDFTTPDLAIWDPAPQDSVDFLTQHWKDISRYVAHVSWRRREHVRKWKHVEIARHVVALATDLATHLGTQRPEWESALGAYLRAAAIEIDRSDARRSPTSRTGAIGATGPAGSGGSVATSTTQSAFGPVGPSPFPDAARYFESGDTSL
jgi:hypothetical protein